MIFPIRQPIHWATALAVATALGGCGPSKSSLPVPAPGTAVVQTAAGGVGGSGIPRPDLRVKSENNLRNIGLAYASAQTQGPVTGPDVIKAHLENRDEMLKSPNDQQPYEIVWNFDPAKVAEGASNVLVAWEKTGDGKGGRCVLLGDLKTVKYLLAGPFEKSPKGKPNS